MSTKRFRLALKKIRQFFVFYLVILKVAFRNTISWCWIWALIHRNHFYTSELIEFKAYSAPASTLIPFSNLRLFFKKFKQPAVLDKLSPQVNVVWKVSGFWEQNLARFNIDTRGKGENLKFWKIEPFIEFTGFSTFDSISFVQSINY